ncbi:MULTISPECIES: hypothetical protein [unclassified Streptomyces]|uniref:hypothetical protein n=1 Tax=unclassified Streptomyces TaxID=2593676 RepID=UPI00225BCCA5|nr:MULTISPECIES: hypothetical protein [unclassified Streptomyces]MCX5050601.1 hypothetical protein [Streptomyces sp. NBC_00474]
MADEQYRWLDRETAELLLRGQSLEAVDAAARDQAERLAKTLDGLTVEPPLSSAELPGEAAALAAFRAARSDASAERAAARHSDGTRDSDAGLIRIGGPAAGARPSRRGRSARFALTAVLAAGMVGGVAFAATTGVLPTPFGHGRPSPGASVSAGAGADRPFLSPSPDSALGEPTPDDSAGGSTGPAAPRGSAGGGTSAEPGSDDRSGHVGGWWLGVPSACRDVRDGKELSGDRRQALEDAAGGTNPRRVWKYCKNVLGVTEGKAFRGRHQDRDGKGKGDIGGRGGHGHRNGQGDQGDQGDRGGDGDGHHIGPGVNGANGGTGVPSASPSPLAPRQLVPRQLAPTRGPSPSPTYSTL